MDDPRAHPAVAGLSLPSVDVDAEARLADLLAPAGPPAERLRRFTEATEIGSEETLAVAERVAELLRARAVEDLDGIDAGSVEVGVGSVAGETVGYRVVAEGATTRLVLDDGRRWTVAEAVEVVTREAYPGRHLARLNRPRMPETEPSAEASVLRGLELVGREVLLGDHELAFELERIGRRIGRRFEADVVLGVRRAAESLAPAVARAVAFGDDRYVAGPFPLDLLVPTRFERDEGPDRPIAWLARAGAPALVSAWLTVTGQTEGLRRLVTEPLTAATLRRELEASSPED